MQSTRGFIIDQWKSNDDLGLTGHLALEWTSYTRALICSGIHLQPGEDMLLWTGGDQSGTLSAENVYNVVASKFWPQNYQIGADQIWSWDLAYKLKLFYVVSIGR
jgi:hypothetical protein